MTNLPQNINQWLDEISKAYIDARETIAFGEVGGITITDEQLFHLAPHVTIKIRGLKRNKTNTKKATEAALSTYAANVDREGLPMDDPVMVFSLCYLASHLGLDLLSEEETEQIMLQIETKRDELLKRIKDI